MKILFVTDLYPLENEKIALALFYFVLEWKKQGHTVDVIRPNFILNTKLRGRTIKKEGIYEEVPDFKEKYGCLYTFEIVDAQAGKLVQNLV